MNVSNFKLLDSSALALRASLLRLVECKLMIIIAIDTKWRVDVQAQEAHSPISTSDSGLDCPLAKHVKGDDRTSVS